MSDFFFFFFLIEASFLAMNQNVHKVIDTSYKVNIYCIKKNDKL